MSLSDIRTIITSGTFILAVVLYLIFVNGTKKDETVVPKSDAVITSSYAEEVTGNQLMEAQYISTNDGDTFKMKLNGEEQGIRLLMVDTPEMNYNENNPMPYAEEAKEFASNILQNAKQIEVLFDVGPETDSYGRLLSYIFVDGVLLQELLLKEGYAAVRYIHEPNNTLEYEFKEIEEQAKEKGLNIWSTENYLQNDGFHPEVIAE